MKDKKQGMIFSRGVSLNCLISFPGKLLIEAIQLHGSKAFDNPLDGLDAVAE